MLRLKIIAILLEIKGMLDDGEIKEAKEALQFCINELSSKEDKKN